MSWLLWIIEGIDSNWKALCGKPAYISQLPVNAIRDLHISFGNWVFFLCFDQIPFINLGRCTFVIKWLKGSKQKDWVSTNLPHHLVRNSKHSPETHVQENQPQPKRKYCSLEIRTPDTCYNIKPLSCILWHVIILLKCLVKTRSRNLFH